MKTNAYIIYADELEMSSYSQHPKQEQIDAVAISATKQGWNGTVLTLKAPDGSTCDLYPSEEALSE